MKTIAIAIALSTLIACVDDPRADSVPDAAVAVCANTVVETCGPRPQRPSSSDAQAVEVWGHDIDLWAKCAVNSSGAQ